MVSELFSKTDKGLVRKNNEDSVSSICYPFFTSLVVCDGVGGCKKGEVASKMCIDKVNQMLNDCMEQQLEDDKSVYKFLLDIVNEVNLEIYAYSNTSHKFKGMGTTLCFAITTKEKTFICNVGDSRAYILKDNNLFQISKDDTLENYLLDNNILSYDRTMNVHALTQVIGNSNGVQPHIYKCDNDYDYLLLCTDGLYNMVSHDEIVKILTNVRLTLKDKIDALINIANSHGGSDNIGISLMRIK